MKKIKLYDLQVRPRDTEESRSIKVCSKDIFKWAIEGNESNLKGIEKILNASKVVEKLDKNTNAEWLELEDAEHKILKDSMDAADFSQINFILYAPELIQAVLDAEKVEEI